MDLIRRRGLTIVALFIAVSFLGFNPSHAGFSDFLKGATEKLAGSPTSTSGASDGDIVQGLKQALQIGTARAVETVSATNGFYDNPKIKIPLPGAVQKVEPALRLVGYGDKVDAFELSMNRAAEKATPQAKALFVDSIKAMSFDDARKVLSGGDNAPPNISRRKPRASSRRCSNPS